MTNINLTNTITNSVLLFGSIYLFSNSQKEMNKILFEHSIKIEANKKELFYPLVQINAYIFAFSGFLMITTGVGTLLLLRNN